MTPPATLQVMPWQLAIARLQPGSDTSWASGHFTSITHTPDEISVVCDAALTPKDIPHKDGFAALRFAGTLDFSLVGVVAKLSAILQAEQISIFVLSTYDTDYILLQESQLATALDSVRKHGYQIEHDEKT